MLHSYFLLVPRKCQSLFCLCAFCPSYLKCFSHASSFSFLFKCHILFHFPLPPNLISAASYLPPRVLFPAQHLTVICNYFMYLLICSFSNEREAPWRQKLCVLFTTLSPASSVVVGTWEAFSECFLNTWKGEWMEGWMDLLKIAWKDWTGVWSLNL